MVRLLLHALVVLFGIYEGEIRYLLRAGGTNDDIARRNHDIDRDILIHAPLRVADGYIVFEIHVTIRSLR